MIPQNIRLFNCDCLELMKGLEGESIDIICIDPPYLYLKNQKLERPFDENLFFSECKRLLTKNGFIVMFGRGESFYRWNTLLADCGFYFKEEVVWNKSHCTSPLMALSRVHETVSIWSKGKGVINKVKVSYLEMKEHDIGSIVTDIKRLKTTFKNTKSLDAVIQYLENNTLANDGTKKALSTTVSSEVDSKDRCASVMSMIDKGCSEKSIIRTDFYQSETFSKSNVTNNNESAGDGDRCVKVLNSMHVGMNEKSIIKQIRDHYSAIHPTQKPVRLLERLLALVLPKNKPTNEIIVADFFGGSFSTMEACYNMGLQGLSCEIDEEYFNTGKQRIENLPPKQPELF